VKKSTKSIVWISSVLLIASAALIIFPVVITRRYGYLDINNGWSKIVWTTFGIPWKSSIQETEFSKLLNELGFSETNAVWKLATQEGFGLFGLVWRRPIQFVDYREGTIKHSAEQFALVIEVQKLEKTTARQKAEHFRGLVQKGDWQEVNEYLKQIEGEKR
jgi:hypothetical protein